MKRSSRNPSRNVLKNFYTFTLGAELAIIAVIAFIGTTPQVQKTGDYSVSRNNTETVSVLAWEEENLKTNQVILDMEDIFPEDCNRLDDFVFQQNDESQEQEEVASEEEEVVIEVKEEVVELDIAEQVTVVASAMPKIATEHVEAMENKRASSSSKAITQQPPVVEELIVPQTQVVEEAVLTKPLDESIQPGVVEEIIINEEIVETISAEAIENAIVTDPSIITEEIAVDTIAIDIQSAEYGHWGPDSPLFSPSGLSVEQIGKVLDGTEMDGLEQVVYDTEQTYGINSCILLAIACNESGYGASRMAHRQNNLFGMMGMKFSSLEENIDYFGQLMVKYRDQWHKTMTANGICRSYVGQNENTAGWPKKITGIMNQIYAKATN